MFYGLFYSWNRIMMNQREIVIVAVLLTKIDPLDLEDIKNNKPIANLVGTNYVIELFKDVISRAPRALENLQWERDDDGNR
jgi:hypothetical protein